MSLLFLRKDTKKVYTEQKKENEIKICMLKILSRFLRGLVVKGLQSCLTVIVHLRMDQVKSVEGSL